MTVSVTILSAFLAISVANVLLIPSSLTWNDNFRSDGGWCFAGKTKAEVKTSNAGKGYAPCPTFNEATWCQIKTDYCAGKLSQYQFTYKQVANDALYGTSTGATARNSIKSFLTTKSTNAYLAQGTSSNKQLYSSCACYIQNDLRPTFLATEITYSCSGSARRTDANSTAGLYRKFIEDVFSKASTKTTITGDFHHYQAFVRDEEGEANGKPVVNAPQTVYKQCYDLKNPEVVEADTVSVDYQGVSNLVLEFTQTTCITKSDPDQPNDELLAAVTKQADCSSIIIAALDEIGSGQTEAVRNFGKVVPNENDPSTFVVKKCFCAESALLGFPEGSAEYVAAKTICDFLKGNNPNN